VSGTGALRRLTVLHLRGAVGRVALDFEPGKRLTLVYGENGTGKSTICDALDLVGNGNVGSLAARGLGRTHEYWPSLGRPIEAIAVTVESADGTCHAAVRRNAVVTKGAPAPRVMVLRRAQITSVIETTDAERYKAIQRFIDVSAVESSEEALHEAVKRATAALDTAARRVDEQRGSVESYWAAAGSPDDDALAWAEQESTREEGTSAEEIRALEQARDY
jgi:ABC-type cobalamin/Fe3+-siderophores transport system ATPase subunit